MKPRRQERRSFFNRRLVLREQRRGYRLWALLLVLFIPGFFLFQEYILATGRITDVSMLPTLSEGQWFLIHKWAYQLRSPQRGDIVVFRPPSQDRWYYVKRIIAVQGDTLSIRQGRAYLNGEPLEELYVRGRTTPEMEPVTLPPGACFVMGDNRPESEDSRQFGLVPLHRIQGRLRPGN